MNPITEEAVGAYLDRLAEHLDNVSTCMLDDREATFVAIHGSGEGLCTSLLCTRHGELLIESLAEYRNKAEQIPGSSLTISCRTCKAKELVVDETFRVVPL